MLLWIQRLPLVVAFYYFYGFTLPLLAQSIPLPSSVYIYGTISNAQSPLVSLDLPKNLLLGEVESYAARIAPDGSFMLYCPLQAPTAANLFHANQQTTLFVFPGDSIAISADAEQWRETLQCKGKKGSERNQFLAEYSRRYEGGTAENAELNAMTHKDAGEYRYHADQQRQQKLHLLATAFSKAPETTFFRFAEAKIGAEWADNLFDYPVIHALKNNLMSTNLTPGYYEFINEPHNWSNPHALPLPRYAELLKKIVTQRIRPTTNAKDYDHSRYYADRHELAKKIMDGKTLFFFQAQNIIDALTYTKPEDIADTYREWAADCPYTEFRTVVDSAYAKAEQLMAGKPAPNFALTDAAGNTVALNSLRGKAVYLDFWASWCGPCLKEMPHSKQLAEKLQGEAVAFVYVSVDENPEAWLNALQKWQLNGKHIWAEGLKSETAQSYNVKGVPRYVLIDSEGNIADGNAKRPSELGIEADILRAIRP
jgi:thiol-disulfide isomerase/thioredoxin